MRLLLTADLRYRLSWFKWLDAQPIYYEAIAISDDLLVVFYKAPLERQVQRTTTFLRSLATKTNVITSHKKEVPPLAFEAEAPFN